MKKLIFWVSQKKSLCKYKSYYLYTAKKSLIKTVKKIVKVWS